MCVVCPRAVPSPRCATRSDVWPSRRPEYGCDTSDPQRSSRDAAGPRARRGDACAMRASEAPPARLERAHDGATQARDCRRGAYGTSTSEGMAVVRPRPSPLLSACARPRLQYGVPLSQGSATLWHGVIGLPTSLPVRGYGRTDAVRRAASAAWSRATFFVLAFQATSKRSPTTGSAPTTVSMPMLAAIRRSTRRGAPRRMAS
jgi:hypothetical protein